MVVGTADRQIVIFNLTQPTTPFKTVPSPLKMQTRTIACFGDGTGYSVGSVEGRVAVQHIDDAKISSNFSFKVSLSVWRRVSDGSSSFPSRAVPPFGAEGTWVQDRIAERIGSQRDLSTPLRHLGYRRRVVSCRLAEKKANLLRSQARTVSLSEF